MRDKPLEATDVDKGRAEQFTCWTRWVSCLIILACGFVLTVVWLNSLTDAHALSVGVTLALTAAAWLFAAWLCLRILFGAPVSDRVARGSPSPPTTPEELRRHGLGPLAVASDLRHLYLDLMKRAVSNVLYEDAPILFYDHEKIPRAPLGFSLRRRVMGEDMPAVAHTMIGIRRLENLQFCLEEILGKNVAGDLVETGVNRGGASIFMKAVLRAHGVKDRRIFACDAFGGRQMGSSWLSRMIFGFAQPFAQLLTLVPSASFRLWYFQRLQRYVLPGFPYCNRPAADLVDFVMWHLRNPGRRSRSANSLEDVKSHFARYGLLDDQVVFLKGFFSETLPKMSAKRLAMLRLDADTYESTKEVLTFLYPKLSPGGYCIIDDYHAFSDCQRAVEEYRAEHHIDEVLQPIDNLGVYWRRGPQRPPSSSS